MNTLTPGRTDSAAYHTDDAWQSLADEQRLVETCARDLAADAFTKQTDKARTWLCDAVDGEGTMRAAFACKSVLDAAIWESSADVSLKVDHLREAFVDECADDFLDAAAEALAEQDADCAADFEDAGVGS